MKQENNWKIELTSVVTEALVKAKVPVYEGYAVDIVGDAVEKFIEAQLAKHSRGAEIAADVMAIIEKHEPVAVAFRYAETVREIREYIETLKEKGEK